MNHKPISLIVAVAENWAIGKDNQLLWHLSDDLKRFKQITSGHTIIMGRKTYDSLPIKPLPNRKNIVLTKSIHEILPSCHMAYTIDQAVSLCDDDKENFVIGGESVYKIFEGICDKLYITKVYKTFDDADTFYPELYEPEWELIESSDIMVDEKSGLSYSWLTYKRLWKKEYCDCGNVATHVYMPGYSNGDNPYHCDDCISSIDSLGCSCNWEYVNDENESKPNLPVGIEGKDWKWLTHPGDKYYSTISKEEKIFVYLDDRGRPYPCCEYSRIR